MPGTRSPRKKKPRIVLAIKLRTRWPELVGMKGEEAKEIIAKECNGCDISILGEVVVVGYRNM